MTMGYNTFVYKLIAIVFSALLAASAGFFHVLLNGHATPHVLSIDLTLNALLMVIIGGVGTLIGPVLGAGVLTLLGHWLSIFFGQRWPLVFGLVFILLVLFFPYGLVGTWRMWYAKLPWKQR